MAIKIRIPPAVRWGLRALVLSAGLSPAALAQSSTTGQIHGRVSAAGAAVIVVEHVDTGARRTITPESDGRFLATSLVPGRYRVQLMRGTTAVAAAEVDVLVGAGSGISFVLTGEGQTAEVAGVRHAIDVSGAPTGVIFTHEALKKTPLNGGIESIIQLAPGTTRGDWHFGGVFAPSLGGASAEENAYFVNGFPIVNVLHQMAFPQPPGGAIAQVQVLTGGLGAAVGRATGGVVNVTTKSGSNNWEAGAGLSFSPRALRAREKNQVFPRNGTTLDGLVALANEDNRVQSYSASTYLGGPIIKDRLFFYAHTENAITNFDVIRQRREAAATTTGIATAGFQEIRDEQPRQLLKIDWNLNGDHRLEYTNLHDRSKRTRKFYGYNYLALERDGIQSGGIREVGPDPTHESADLEILNYIGRLTDRLTVAGLVGWSRTPYESVPAGYDARLSRVFANQAGRAPGLAYIFPQPIEFVLVPGAHDSRKGHRIDLEYRLDGHTVRGGIDSYELTSFHGTAISGGGSWIYRRLANPSASPFGPPIVAPNTPGQTVLGQQGYFVRRDVAGDVARSPIRQSAQYIEDRWQVTDRLLLTFGLRNEQSDNRNGEGESYLKLDRQLAPRIAGVWDVDGRAALKVFGTYGRYHLPMPNAITFNIAGSPLSTSEYFTYTGVDPVTGAPTGLVSMGPVVSLNNAFGQALDPRQVAARGIKGHFHDEFTLGFEKALTPRYTLGARLMLRDLKSTIDDMCDDRPFRAWAARQTPMIDTSNWRGGCFLFNPGVANRFTVDLNGDGVLEEVSLSKEQLGFAKLKRKYSALDLFLEHPLHDRWYGKLTYTYSKSRGNTEGLVNSDSGQLDATTLAFDFPELGINARGPLPNDRRHQMKAYGYVEWTAQWSIGLNMLAVSGRPKSCYGNYPDPANAAYGYGSHFFYCNGVASPRGSRGRLPAEIRFDLNVSYTPQWLRGLQFRMNVFNLFNRQTPEASAQDSKDGITGNDNPSFGGEKYTPPRSVTFAVQYDHKF